MNCLSKNIEPILNGSECATYQAGVGPAKAPMASGSIRLLEWDTRFFGFPCARIEGLQASGSQRERQDNAARVISDLLDWSKAQGIQFIAAKIPADPALAQALELQGFYLTDTAMGFTRQGTDNLSRPELPNGFAFQENPDDAETIAAAFSQLFWDGRFHHDPEIATTTADRLWQEAVKNQLSGEADFSLLLTCQDQPAGLVTIAKTSDGGDHGCLFIVGLREPHRHKGLGGILLTEAIHLASNSFGQLEVETSTYNLPAIRLYLSVGFKPVEARVSFHRWQGK